MGFVAVSTHAPLQSSRPVGHAQVLALQTSPPVQTLPQVPQFIGSLVTLTHAPPQSCCCVGQPVLVQAPFTQASPASHTVPHAPQLRKLVVVSMQSPLHDVCPTGQVHCPVAQI